MKATCHTGGQQPYDDEHEEAEAGEFKLYVGLVLGVHDACLVRVGDWSATIVEWGSVGAVVIVVVFVIVIVIIAVIGVAERIHVEFHAFWRDLARFYVFEKLVTWEIMKKIYVLQSLFSELELLNSKRLFFRLDQKIKIS